jgi:phenylalanyl-tRNA synthetase alpha chain
MLIMKIERVRTDLLERVKQLENPRDILKTPELKELYKLLPELPAAERAKYGREINDLKDELTKVYKLLEQKADDATAQPLDVTAPFDVNSTPPRLLPTENGTIHPLTRELAVVIDIFTRMGFEAIESRQLDDDYHMFTSLNFPPGHPARDMYDAFWTAEGFVPPGHTSTMQNRIIKAGREKLQRDGQIAAISTGRVFRNEDTDATHEHTFYQCEGVFVSPTATLGQLIGVLQSFLETYYEQKLRYKTQPGYFPFVEPGIEFLIEKPKTIGGKSGEWLELVPGGMIHPNVLEMAGVDPKKYRGFAWGLGIERLVMLKYGINDIRLFESGKLAFLREFR